MTYWSRGSQRLELVQGDITDQVVDAIVNAANAHLAGGGGVDGAIHRRGGPEIMQETRRRYPDGCSTGSAVISAAGNLPAKFVIHAVGPFYRDGRSGEPGLLAAAYQASLQLATAHDCRSLAFPSLSTGAYRFPIEEASRIALSTCLEYLKVTEQLRLVRFVLFDQFAFQAFKMSLEEFD